MTTEEKNYSTTPLIVAIGSLILAIIALGVAVVLVVPILRKSYSSIPITPVVPFALSRTQSLPSSLPTTNPELMPTELGSKSRAPSAIGSFRGDAIANTNSLIACYR